MGNVHGGSIMKMVDVAAAVAAMRHCGRQVVTVALDHMNFLEPVFIGDLVTITSHIAYVGRSSMVVHATVEAENPATGRKVLTSSCMMTFVALGEDGHPVAVPPVEPQTPEEQASMDEARRLYEHAKAMRKG
jgi:acyl-CoA hydrolase